MEPTDEFDDIDRSNAPYISSAKATQAMRDIAARHGLAFTYNPGGGQFYTSAGFNCQISTCDDVEDLKTLRAAVG